MAKKRKCGLVVGLMLAGCVTVALAGAFAIAYVEAYPVNAWWFGTAHGVLVTLTVFSTCASFLSVLAVFGYLASLGSTDVSDFK